jgi:hypothetical protein
MRLALLMGYVDQTYRLFEEKGILNIPSSFSGKRHANYLPPYISIRSSNSVLPPAASVIKYACAQPPRLVPAHGATFDTNGRQGTQTVWFLLSPQDRSIVEYSENQTCLMLAHLQHLCHRTSKVCLRIYECGSSRTRLG